MKRIVKLLAFSFVFFACKNEQPSANQLGKLGGKTENATELPSCEQPETKRVAEALRGIFGAEVEGLVKENRQFCFDKYDLNSDGKDEYFVGLFSPYFCGSGGCTAFVLNNDLSVHSRFTVVDYPFYISKRYVTDGWANLFIYSDRGFHLVKFDGEKYPANPSTEPDVVIDNYPDRVVTLLDIKARKCTF